MVLFAGTCFGQQKEFNPFESIGKQGKILTLSNGKYTEIHINDTLQRIGSVIVNMNDGSIYDILNTDTLYNESNLDPTVITRWYSPDPIVKHHESPYASMANSPIWVIDPNGADSALASGGTTWMWKTEAGDTYNSISERTKVAVEDLRCFNSDIPNDKSIPTGAMINISDPNCSSPNAAPAIQTYEGSTNIFIYGERSGGVDKAGVPQAGVNEIGVNFTPNPENSCEEYMWFQTFNTNDPKQYNRICKSMPLSPDRSLVPFLSWESDEIAGMNAYRDQGKMYLPNGVVINPAKNPIGMYDHPGRPNINSGTIVWNGTLSLLKKVDGNYVVIQTLRYSWSQQGTNNMMDPIIYSDEDVDPNSFHQQCINIFFGQ